MENLAGGHGAPRRSAAGDAERAAHPGGGDHDDRGGDVRVQAADQGGGRDERAAHAATSQDGGGGGISFKKRRRLPRKEGTAHGDARAPHGFTRGDGVAPREGAQGG